MTGLSEIQIKALMARGAAAVVDITFCAAAGEMKPALVAVPQSQFPAAKLCDAEPIVAGTA